MSPQATFTAELPEKFRIPPLSQIVGESLLTHRCCGALLQLIDYLFKSHGNQITVSQQCLAFSFL